MPLSALVRQAKRPGVDRAVCRCSRKREEEPHIRPFVLDDSSWCAGQERDRVGGRDNCDHSAWPTTMKKKPQRAPACALFATEISSVWGRARPVCMPFGFSANRYALDSRFAEFPLPLPPRNWLPASASL